MAIEWQYMMDIRPNWVNQTQGANWEAAVRELFRYNASTKTGQVLFNGIRVWNKWVVIEPYDFTQGACNAYADDRVGVARDGKSYGAFVSFSPHLFAPGGSCAVAAPDNAGLAPNEILFHELVHAFRIVAGKLDMTVATTGGLVNFEWAEELYAIVLTNILITDPTNTRKTRQRRDHLDGSPQDPDFETSFGFFETSTNTFDLIKKFCSDHPGLSPALAKVPATFNPIAAFLNDPVEAQKRSRKARAILRDAVAWGRAIRALLPF
jgi:hypothetical protein